MGRFQGGQEGGQEVGHSNVGTGEDGNSWHGGGLFLWGLPKHSDWTGAQLLRTNTGTTFRDGQGEGYLRSGRPGEGGGGLGVKGQLNYSVLPHECEQSSVTSSWLSGVV